MNLSDPVAYHAFLDEMEKLSADAATRRRMRGEFKGRDALAYSFDGVARKVAGRNAALHTSRARRSKALAENAARNLDKPGRQLVVQVQSREAARQAAEARRSKDAARTGRYRREPLGPAPAVPGRIKAMQDAKRNSRAGRQSMYENLFGAEPEAQPVAPKPQATSNASTSTSQPKPAAPDAPAGKMRLPRIGKAGKVGLGVLGAGALFGGGMLAGRASKRPEMKKVAGLPRAVRMGGGGDYGSLLRSANKAGGDAATAMRKSQAHGQASDVLRSAAKDKERQSRGFFNTITGRGKKMAQEAATLRTAANSNLAARYAASSKASDAMRRGQLEKWKAGMEAKTQALPNRRSNITKGLSAVSAAQEKVKARGGAAGLARPRDEAVDDFRRRILLTAMGL